MTLPDYDGLYFLERIPKEIIPKVIVCSGDVSISTHTKLKDYPIQSFYIKPIEIKELIREINS